MNSRFGFPLLSLRVLLSVLLLPLAFLAEAADADKTVPPDKLITNLFNAVTEQVKENEARIQQDKSYLVKIGEDVLLPYVSFETMAKQILGKNWRKITPQQQQRYTTAFKDRVSSSIVSQYDPAKKYDLEVNGFRTNDRGDQAAVTSEVVERQTGKKYQISYRLFIDKKTGLWQVYDVAVEGVSVLQSFKSASAEDFRRNGIEYMIAQLENSGTEDKTVQAATKP